MPNTEAPYCLVLGGGGAKGVYHIGVWQALSEMGIPVNAFIGNSIGAVVSAFLAQGAEKELLNIARSMKLSSLIRLNKDQALTDESTIRDHSLNYWQGVYRNLIEKRGLDTTPMREILESTVEEESIRNSGLDFGITTVNVSDFKPREVFIEQMEPGQLINYIMASAAFPGFARPEIDGKKYIDGGLYDNVPYTMAKRRGYRKIILVDISGVGLNRRPKTEGTQTVYIKNSIDMGNAFDFNPEFIDNFWRLGYLDTKRSFGGLIGYHYFVEPDDQAEIDWNESPFQEFAALYSNEMAHDRRHRLKTLETCATLLDIDRIQQYTYPSLQDAIINKVKQISANVDQVIEDRKLDANASSSQLLDAFVKEILDDIKRDDSPYFYLELIHRFNPSRTLSLAEKGIRRLNPELSILETFLKQVAG